MLSCPQRHIPPQEHIGPLPGRSARAKRPGYPGWDGRGHPVGRAAAARGSPHQPKIMNFEEKTSHSPGVTCGKRPCTWVAPPARHTSGSAVVSAHRGSQGACWTAGRAVGRTGTGQGAHTALVRSQELRSGRREEAGPRRWTSRLAPGGGVLAALLCGLSGRRTVRPRNPRGSGPAPGRAPRV